MNDWVTWLGARFSPEAYLFWTRIQCLAWSCADLAIVFYCVRIANLARTVAQQPRHRVPYLILAATACLLPTVALAVTGMQIFLIELLVTVPHFVLILYLIASNLAVAPQALAKLLKGAGGVEECAQYPFNEPETEG